MRVVSFIADSPSEALGALRSRFGNEAVLLRIRPLELTGEPTASAQVEVLAGVANESELPTDGNRANTLHAVLRQVAELNRQMAVAAQPTDAAAVRQPVAAKPRMENSDGSPRQSHSAPTAATMLAPKPPPAAVQPDAPEAGHPARALRMEPIPPDSSQHAELVMSLLAACAEDGGVPPKPADNAPPNAPRTVDLLVSLGLLPGIARQVESRLLEAAGQTGPLSLEDELACVRRLLVSRWKSPASSRSDNAPPVHLFVGAPGVGKTTCLSKWLARTVLVEGRSARLWRLDGPGVNTAEALSVYGEALGVPVHRGWPSGALPAADAHFVDLPGIDWRSSQAVQAMALRLQNMGPVEVHLVLNAAYESEIAFAQIQVFRRLGVRDLIFTHLDEEARWGKLWNFVWSVTEPIRFLSAGQNVPTGFLEASPERLLTGLCPSVAPVSTNAPVGENRWQSFC